MRILLLSWYFPPINDIGAIRVGKLAEYLHTQGHDVWVVTARRNDPDRSLPLAFPSARVVSTNWLDVDRLSSPWNWIPRKPADTDKANGNNNAGSDGSLPSSPSLREKLSRNYMWLVRIPDRQAGWLPYLRRAASRLLSKHKFDLIYASGPPFTAFFAAKNLSRRFGVPWVAEYRDSWSDHFNYMVTPKWRQRLDTFFEHRVTPSAAGIVTVSDPWAQLFDREFHKPTVAIYNGFDSTQAQHIPSQGRPGLPMTIVHMGAVYLLRDPTALFEAIKLAGIKPGEVEIAFYGAVRSSVMPLAEKCGVAEFVTVRPRVPYDKALEIQRTSDVLLLLQSPTDIGHVPGKTFEYFAARRPILGLGHDQGIPARLVRERSAGCYATDAAAVARQLKTWVEQKRSGGLIGALPESAAAGLSREEQFAKLAGFLEHLAHPARATFVVARPHIA